MNPRVFSVCFMVASILPTTALSQSFLSQYHGLPSQDSRYTAGPQKIPGTFLCAYYDLGGEGVAYHDTDAKNHGGGELNPADGTYLKEFHIHEGVDTPTRSFSGNQIWLTTTPATRSCLRQTCSMLAGPSPESGPAEIPSSRP